ncbi:MAG: HEAT repeat domain-containing protein [Sedimentisphaerales bacterium]|nr:HEAT repeat domain-containing protein [Sedimentisphaerales bacterium]
MLVMASSCLNAQHKDRTFARPEYPVSMWYSTGDALFEYKWMPMDSEATVNAAFDILQSRYNVDRILWRDANIEWVAKWDKPRDRSFYGDSVVEWINIARTSRAPELAALAAKQRGMKFWGIFHMFDYGGKAETDAGAGIGQWHTYDPWLIQYPEYCVWDRAHITFMTGMIEYGYPQVRKEYLRRMEEMFKGPFKKYDGLFVYTYMENTVAHYTDEFIYSDIACDQYKKMYGVDPRKEPFDLEKYYAIRGEYITQYLRELRPLFKKYGKKLAIVLNSDKLDLPQCWIGGGSDILHQGRVKMDWRTWVKEGLVDELHVWGGVSPKKKIENVQEVLKVTKGTPVQVTVFYSQEFPASAQYLYAEGVQRLITTDSHNEEGGMEKRPVSDIDSADPDAVLNVLTQARKKELDLPTEKIAALLRHPHPFVRRQAANTIGTLKLQAGVPSLEQAVVADPEESVRAMMIDALGKVNGPNSVQAIAQAYITMPRWPVRIAARGALAAMGPERYPDLAKALDNQSSVFRAVLMESFHQRETVREMLPTILKGLNDSDEQVRWEAVFSLSVYPCQEAVDALLKVLDDKSDYVQNRAATSLKIMLPKASDELRQRVFDKLMVKYQEFGPGSKRTDKDWGWRPIGDAIRDGFGTKGKNALIDILNGKNTELAKLTWKVLFLRNDQQWHPVERNVMEKQYKYYPGRSDRQACPPAVLD